MDKEQPSDQINAWLGRQVALWRSNKLWDDPGEHQSTPPIHQALSALAAIIGDDEVVYAVGEVFIGEDSYETTGFDVTIWTEDLVLRAERSGGNLTPVVSVNSRRSLAALEVLRAPIVSSNDFYLIREDRTEFRLTYPGRTPITLKGRSDSPVLDLLPSFVEDLQAGFG